MEKFRKNPLIIIVTTVFIDLLGFSIVIPILAPLLALPYQSALLPDTAYDQRLIIFGFLIASYAIAQFFGAPILGQLSDRYGRKPILGISLIGTLVSRILFIYGIVVANLPLLFFSRILDGLTGGNISIAQSAIADITTKENKAKNFGLIGAAFGLGFVIGPWLGGKLGDSGLITSLAQTLPSWIASSSTLPLWFATILCLLNIIAFFFLFPETIKEKIKNKFVFFKAITNTISAFKVPKMRVTLATLFLFTLGFTFFTQFLSVYVGGKFETEIKQTVDTKIANGDIKITIPESISQIPVPQVKDQAIAKYKEGVTMGFYEAESQSRSSDLFSYIGIWVVIAQGFVVRQLSKKFKSTTLLKWGLILNAASALIFLIPNQFSMLFFIVPLFALSNGLLSPNLQAIISNSADEKSQGEALGGSQSIQSLAQAIPPIVSGYVASVSLNLPIVLSSGLTFLSFLVFALFFRAQSKEKLHEE
jgi:DHA1 family tetracycline resistance protein-like MFS transporter